MADLLVEIGTEELPPMAVRPLSEALGRGICAGLHSAGLGYEKYHCYATPRRLALLVEAVDAVQAPRVQERRGPALKAAFDDRGQPTAAALGFARSNGVAVQELETLENSSGRWLVYRARQAGQATALLLPRIVEEVLAALPIPKRMRWSNLRTAFVRPVHWVVLMMDEEVVPALIYGIASGRETRGHRFHHPRPLRLERAASYARTLQERAQVIADFQARREAVRTQVMQAAASVGGTPAIHEALLEEVTALVEWPVALVADFAPRFLQVPAEALVSAMQRHQKCFPVVDPHGILMPHFVAVSNIDSANPQKVADGNARVMAARLADAEFFYRADLRRPLTELLDELRDVVFHEQLGSLRDKAERVSALAGRIAAACGVEAPDASRAGLLSKCDLMTSMVGEFPELQGTMGRHYAAHGGESDAVAQALEEQYLPRHAGDRIAVSACGKAVSIADKLDTLVGVFGIGQIPTGDEDPFGLRRAALGAARTLIEGEFPMDLEQALLWACEGYAKPWNRAELLPKAFDFVMQRLRAWYQDLSVPMDVFEAVLARRPTCPLDFHRRVAAVQAFTQLPEAPSLAAATKRVANILRRSSSPIATLYDDGLLQEPAELQLAEELAAQKQAVAPLIERAEYTLMLQKLALLRSPVDRFFDEVLVMADDPDLRANRLALLQQLQVLFLQVADISRLTL